MEKQKIQKISYQNQEVYFLHEENFSLLERIQERKYEILEEFKNDNRTYVAKILMEGKFYILKKIFYPRKIKKYLSSFKRGDSVDGFFNIEFGRSCGIEELAKILIVQVKREKYQMKEEICLMEYCSGKHLETEEGFLKTLETLKKIHAIQRFHGDCNPNNFLFEENAELKVVDTKLKKMKFGNYRAHYDLFTFFQYFDFQGEYPYPKNFYYYTAYLVRKMRNFRGVCKEKRNKRKA